MNRLILPAPLATALVTRQPDDPRYQGWAEHVGNYLPPPMGAQWVTQPTDCPYVGERVEFVVDEQVNGEGGEWYVIPHVVGSGVIAESLRITDRRYMPDHGPQVTVNPATGTVRHVGTPLSGVFDDITNQRHGQDWSAGRWAWRITEAVAS